MIRKLFHRADTVVTDPEDPQSEKEHVKTALRRCGYENWSFKRACIKKQPQLAANKDSTKSTTTNKTVVVAPYVQGVSEKFRRVFSSYGVSICFKPHQTLRKILVAPKDRTKVEDQTGVVYHIPRGGCNKVMLVKPRDQSESALKNILQNCQQSLCSGRTSPKDRTRTRFGQRQGLMQGG